MGLQATFNYLVTVIRFKELVEIKYPRVVSKLAAVDGNFQFFLVLGLQGAMRKKTKQASKGKSGEENAIKKRKKRCGFVRAESGFPFESMGQIRGEGKAIIGGNYEKNFASFSSCFGFAVKGFCE